MRSLRVQPKSTEQLNKIGQTPLHLAARWPLGVRVLLQHGACVDSEDLTGRRPLEYAIELGFAESVSLLMKAKYYGTPEPSNHYRKSLMGIGPSYHNRCSLIRAIVWCKPYWLKSMLPTPQEAHEAVLEVIIVSLSQGRRDLERRLKSSSVPSRIKCRLLQNDRILDEHAPYAERILNQYDASLTSTSTLLHNFRTMYHIDYLTVSLAEKLWQAGFHDVCVPDLNGKTPLILFRTRESEVFEFPRGFIELSAWLVRKGARLHRLFHPLLKEEPDDGVEMIDVRSTFRALHWVAATVGYFAKPTYIFPRGDFARWLLPNRSGLTEIAREFLVSLLSDPSQDQCRCACSIHGCRAYTMMAKVFVNRKIVDLRGRAQGTLMPPRFLVGIVGSNNPCLEWLFAEIVRLLTFQELELRHTCCRYDARLGINEFDDVEAIAEIRYEDAESIQILESLLQEFGEKKGSDTIVGFIEGYWATRMDEVLQARKESIDREKIREIGVILKPDEPEEEKYDAFLVERYDDHHLVEELGESDTDND